MNARLGLEMCQELTLKHWIGTLLPKGYPEDIAADACEPRMAGIVRSIMEKFI